MSETLTETLLAELAEIAEAQGLLRLAAVDLRHPGFDPARAALNRFVAEGRHGEMDFMARTTDVRKHPEQMLPGARSMLVVLVPYRGEDGPVARYARSADYHTAMHRRLDVVAEALRERLPGVQTLVCVDTKPVLERSAAALAGLGFIGKNGCVIAPGLGSYVLLGEILTTAVWTGRAVDARDVVWDACGSCRRCLDACPTDAFTEPGRLDPRRCISYLTIEHRGAIDDALADAIGERIAGCDVCQEVCPYNASLARDARVPAAAWIEAPSGGARTVDAVALAAVGSGRYRAFVRDTALRRIPRRSLRRNALVALGNRAGQLQDREREVVEAAARDADPHVRSAAARVLARRG
jgi:epoxyqueuosine reductase